MSCPFWYSKFMDILMFILKPVSVIYAIAFYADLTQDHKWVFGWGEGFKVTNNFSEWIQNHKIFGLKIAWFIFCIPMVPLVALYTMHPFFLCYWVFNT